MSDFADLPEEIQADWISQDFRCAKCQCRIADPWFSKFISAVTRKLYCEVCVRIHHCKLRGV